MRSSDLRVAQVRKVTAHQAAESSQAGTCKMRHVEHQLITNTVRIVFQAPKTATNAQDLDLSLLRSLIANLVETLPAKT